MRIIDRVKISLVKNLGKTIILLLLVIVLKATALSAVIAENAVFNTVENARKSLPAIISVGGDSEAIDELYTRQEQSAGYAAHLFDPLTREQIHQIGALPYVRHYDYSITAMASISYESEQLEFGKVTVHGVANPEMIYITEGLLELEYGRSFTSEEIANAENKAPILISDDFATLYELTISDRFDMYVEYFFLPENANPEEDWPIQLESYEELWEHPYFNWGEKGFEFEVIGIFTIPPEEAENMYYWHKVGILNSVYTPNWRSHEMYNLQMTSSIESSSVFRVGDDNTSSLQYTYDWSDPFWVLYDISYFDDFQSEASEFLPDFWAFEDLSSTLEHLYDSVNFVSQFIQRALWFAMGASVIILNLLITLYLRDRRKELGVYIALGEKKIKIALQIILEVLIVASAGFVLAIFIAHILAPHISQNMLRNELSQERTSQVYWSSTNTLEMRGFGRELTIEETIAAFDVSINTQIIYIAFGVAILTVIVSTIVPIAYIFELNPKEILISAEGK